MTAGLPTGRFSWLIVVMSSLPAGSLRSRPSGLSGPTSVMSVRPNAPSAPGIVDVPGELLGDDADDRALPLGRRNASTRALQNGNREERQQDDLGHQHAALDPGGPPARARRGSWPRVRAAPEADQHVDEEDAPADEQHQHQPVHQHHDLDRRRRRAPTRRPACRATRALAARSPVLASAFSDEVRAPRATGAPASGRSRAKQPSTTAVTPSSTRMPAFMLSRTAGSSPPKQTDRPSC